MKAAEEASAPLLARIDLLELELKAETTRRKQLELLREHDERRIAGVDMVYEECKRLEARWVKLREYFEGFWHNWIDESNAPKVYVATAMAKMVELEKAEAARPRPSTGHTEPEARRCGICGGVVQHDGGAPDRECWPNGRNPR